MKNIRKPYFKKPIDSLYETMNDKGESVVRFRSNDNRERFIGTSLDPNKVPGGDTPSPSPMPSGGGMVEVTWQELKDKRDNGELNPGSLYRITDYQCTTTQENTQSAGHQFDIVLLALSENKLAEEGWAMMHENIIYDVKFSDGRKKCYIAKDTYYSEEDEGEVRNIVDLETGLGVRAYVDYLEIDEENKEAYYPFDIVCLSVEDLEYNYFQNSKLEAWKVWYCLDNDTTRFAWADDSVTKDLIKVYNNHHLVEDYCWRRPNGDKTIQGINYYYWANDELSPTVSVFTTTETPTTNDKFYWFNGPVNPPTEGGNILDVRQGGEVVGRGVIYRLIDEWNNDVPYDFKNIQFIEPVTDGWYDPEGEDTWCYTFSLTNGGVLMDASILNQEQEESLVFAKNNYISPFIDDSRTLPENVFLGDDVKYNNHLYNCDGIILDNPFALILYETFNMNPYDLELKSIYIGGKKVLTEE